MGHIFTGVHKNQQFIFSIGLTSQSDTKLLQVNPTIAAGDFKVSIDGAAFANLTNLPAVTPAGGRAVKFIMAAADMNGDYIFIQAVDAAGTEWCDDWISISTVPADASLVQVDGTALVSATLNLKKINVVNSSGDAIVATSTGSNGAGIVATGNGSGQGIYGIGGSTGNGLTALGGATSGSGIYAAAQTNGAGFNTLGVGSAGPGFLATGGTNSDGFQAVGVGTGSGLVGQAGLTGHGAIFVGGATSGNGISSTAIGAGTGATLVGVGAASLIAAQGLSGPLDAGERNNIADALLKRDWTAVTGEAARSVLNALRAIRNKWSFSGNTQTITKEDNTTAAWTATVTTNAAAEPVISFTGN